jgi:hypothetical protein
MSKNKAREMISSLPGPTKRSEVVAEAFQSAYGSEFDTLRSKIRSSRQ